eukprot:Protomagalhaensia_wolfi_Nauph_80__749@NODE_142_length_3458_cov_539_000292_g98_i2_p2_GENE_NODE_142_length_3458_cov_539_000292_g98_i2NODE_142_length_3458_cov_539_000292_g98_i2_p2_ORF_typecomplete_len183_score52_22ADH_zinc_N/PF00107_26/5_6e09Glu_dehyd_C/PF16912_5/5e07AlaDh_PNT_C/PF01262_21/1_5e05Pyr_redox_2/PF07992_14/0_00812Hacid_dh_C/PF02826_19/0_087MTS/PF05175_14/0_17UDPG_MGDP_dh_N/PF03721_14/0_13AdoHcyase_NAD/PF00670_21/0_21FAD_binding_3/PF01494_19/0_22_NODE_142_length_3458_cov_539_000292_g98_i
MAFAATPPFDGTLAKYYVLPEDYCFKIPDHVSYEEAAVVEPLGVAVHLNKRAETKFGNSIIVFGAGPVGLLCLAVARAFGATKRITVDVNEDRADFAMKYAATHKFLPKKDETPEATAQRLKEECGLGDGALFWLCALVVPMSKVEWALQKSPSPSLISVSVRSISKAVSDMDLATMNWPLN